MVLFSAKARRVLDDAVGLLPDAQQRAQWRRWSTDHPQTRQPGGPSDDGAEPLPEAIVAIALTALEAKAGQLRTERSAAAENAAFVFDNDLSSDPLDQGDAGRGPDLRPRVRRCQIGPGHRSGAVFGGWRGTCHDREGVRSRPDV